MLLFAKGVKDLHFGGNKKLVTRRIVITAVIIFCAVMQNACGTLKLPFAARPLFLIPLCVCISMFESNTASAVFGAFAGVIWDVSSAYDGFNAVVIMVLGAVCSLLISHFMRNNIVTAFVLCAVSIFTYEILYAAIFMVLCGVSLIPGFLEYSIPVILLTAVFIPVCYFAVKLIYGERSVSVDFG